MPRTLADGKLKFTVLTTQPLNPAAPTATELNDGIHAEAAILSSDFAFGATDSEKVAEKALNQENNANAIGASNYTAGVSVWRYFATTTPGQGDPTADAVFEALKEKGTTVWCYARETGKDADDAWAAEDEIYLGAEVVTDEPQPPSDRGGFVKRRIPMEVQRAWPNIAVATGP